MMQSIHHTITFAITVASNRHDQNAHKIKCVFIIYSQILPCSNAVGFVSLSLFWCSG